MNFKESITRLLKLSLLFLFLGYYSSITLFYHAHIVDGEVIVHSHFYKSDADNKTPFKNHSHPVSAYNLIYQLNKVNSEELNVDMPYRAPFFPVPSILRCIVEQTVYNAPNFSLPSRGPPAC
jgi:hypothetical protein